MLTSAEATRNIWRSSTSFMPTMSREAAKPRKNRFAESRASAHLFSASWFHFMQCPEVGGVSIAVRQRPIPGDVVDETHSAWTLELVGATGKVCTVSWRTFRKWNDSRVVLEHHYDHQQSGEPLSHGDLRLNVLERSTGFPKSS